MPPTVTTELVPGQMMLYDYYTPSLEGGEYQTTVTPAIPTIDTQGWFQPIDQIFAVRAPQFFLEPNDVGEMFPPANANGMFGAVLPNVVLNNRAIPWERLMVTSDKTVPWLALMTLTETEIVPDPVTTTAIRSTTVAQFLAPDPVIQKPALDPQFIPPDILETTMQSIVVTAETFTGVLPKLTELKYLAHVRQTDTSDQVGSDAVEDGWYSVVLGNRFPDSTVGPDGAGTKNIVCLVSVEGFAASLPGSGAPSKPYVQLAVLANWAFVSNPAAGENFADLMENFVTQEGGNPDNLLPRIPASGASSAALTRLLDGYTALTYHTITSEETFAWYRGPLSPVIPQPIPPPAGSHYQSASEVMIYVQAEGVFDLSYGAAFQIGQMIALSDQAFAEAVMNGQKQAFAMMNRIGDRLVSGRFNDMPVAELVDENLARKQFAAALRNGATEELRQTFLRMDGSTAARQATSPRPARVRAARSVDPVAQTRSLLARDDVRGVLQQWIDDDLDPITEWLAHLALLYNVPFNHLIPDQRMLPVESIRFFYIDPAWINAMLDGALGIGVESSRDTTLHATIREPLLRRVHQKAGRLRAKKRKRPRLAVTTDGDSPVARSGILIRSAVVSGWPGLVVVADDGATPIVRIDRLSDTVLLVLFAGIPGTIRLSQPWHGLQFGVEDGDVIQLRSPVGVPLGSTFPSTGGFSQFYRSQTGPGARVMNIDQLVPQLSTAAGFPMTPGTFAIEMIQAPERLSFIRPS